MKQNYEKLNLLLSLITSRHEFSISPPHFEMLGINIKQYVHMVTLNQSKWSQQGIICPPQHSKRPQFHLSL